MIEATVQTSVKPVDVLNKSFGKEIIAYSRLCLEVDHKNAADINRAKKENSKVQYDIHTQR